MKRVISFVLLLFIVQSGSAVQPDVLTVDFDDVISIRQKPGIADFATLIARVAFWHPSFLSAFLNFNALELEGRRVASTVDGAANIIHRLLRNLHEQGYPDLSYYESDIIERSINPKPLDSVIDFLRALKGMGYTLVGATNQDYLQNKVYRKKMKDQGVDLDALFDGIVTTRVHHLDRPNGKEVQEDAPYTELEKGVYMLTNSKATKPSSLYYQALRRVARKIHPQARRFIHVDDKQENVGGARDVDFEAILFNLPAGTARKSSPAELNRALDGYRKGLGKLGIADNPGAEIGLSGAFLAD